MGLDHGVKEYQKFCGNLYIRKGHHGMTVSQIRSMVLSEDGNAKKACTYY